MLPGFVLVVVSFATRGAYGQLEWTFTLENYQRLAGFSLFGWTSDYLIILWRSVVVACPKLDDTRPYASKLAAILRDPSIPKATVVRMEVPCCGGLTSIASEAKALSGRASLDDVEFGNGVIEFDEFIQWWLDR